MISEACVERKDGTVDVREIAPKKIAQSVTQNLDGTDFKENRLTDARCLP
jgi:hypothetical protein